MRTRVMMTRGMVALAAVLLAGLTASLAFAQGGSGVQTSGASAQPAAGSPPGAQYQLPLDRARRDASPRSRNGGAGGSGSGDFELLGGSVYRSENNFGSSSRVPGDPHGGKGDAALPVAETGDPSELGSFSLLALIALTGVGLGLGARRRLDD